MVFAIPSTMKTLFLSFTLLVFSNLNLFSQEIIERIYEPAKEPKLEETPSPAPTREKNIYPPDTSVIIDFPDSLAEFPGGQTSLMDFVKENFKMPDELKDTNIQGKVYVRFIIERNGSVSYPEILRGLHPLIDKEVKRLVLSFPKWKPAKSNDQIVRSKIAIPVRVGP